MHGKTQYALMAWLAIPLLAGALMAQDGELHEEYKGIKELEIETVSGDCIIEGSSGNKVVVDLNYSYRDNCFEPLVDKSGGRLRIRERFHGSWCSGHSEWTISVPREMDIDFSSASGELTLSNCEGRFTMESASGGIEVSNCAGDFEIDNASGRIRISDSEGEFEVDNASGRIILAEISGRIELDNASGNVDMKRVKGRFSVDNASGDIEANGIEIEDRSEFDTASGDIEITLAATPKHDMELETASGDVVLNYGGNPMVGQFEFTARRGRGRIDAPYKFEVEEEFVRGHSRWDDDVVYERKSFTREQETPMIIMGTASGRVELRLE
ncbi:DUF4097 domain-containing protein [Candidatus Neomarinimicrobiota bacterium]